MSDGMLGAYFNLLPKSASHLELRKDLATMPLSRDKSTKASRSVCLVALMLSSMESSRDMAFLMLLGAVYTSSRNQPLFLQTCEYNAF